MTVAMKRVLSGVEVVVVLLVGYVVFTYVRPFVFGGARRVVLPGDTYTFDYVMLGGFAFFVADIAFHLGRWVEHRKAGRTDTAA